MRREQISTDEAPAPSGAYSQGIRLGNVAFLAGQGPFDATGALVGESVAEQTRQVLENLDAVARAEGSSLANAVRVGVYLSDMSDFDEMNAEYVKHFSPPLPARTTIQSHIQGFHVEIDAVIAIDDAK